MNKTRFLILSSIALSFTLVAQEAKKIQLVRPGAAPAAAGAETKAEEKTDVNPAPAAPAQPGQPAAAATPGAVGTTATEAWSRVSFSGYFRMMARDDFGAGSTTLGYQPAQGRLMNETPWLMLGVNTTMIRNEKPNDIKSDLFFRIEGGSFRNADTGFGSLANYRFTLLHLSVENAVVQHSLVQIGTIWYNMGYIGMYDAYVSQLFWETVGIRFGQRIADKLEYFLAVGDSGYSLLQERLNTNTSFPTTGYNSTPTFGGLVKYNWSTSPLKDFFKWAERFETGIGFQMMIERSTLGSPNAPYQTPGIPYEDVIRGEGLKNWLAKNPGLQDYFPTPSNRNSSFWKISFWNGFNIARKFGPVKLNWNDTSVSFARKRPDRYVEETHQGITKKIYVNDFTNKRHELIIADEMQWTLIKDRLDVNLGTIMIFSWDNDNTIKPSEANRNLYTFTVRPQFYFTSILHALLEVSYTTEVSTLGNLYREHFDSIESSTGGSPDNRGLEYGETNMRNTLQVKLGPVLNPNGRGIYNRPTIRLLFGVQLSNVHAAFPNNYVPALNSNNVFNYGKDVNEHYMVSLEVEHWWN